MDKWTIDEICWSLCAWSQNLKVFVIMLVKLYLVISWFRCLWARHLGPSKPVASIREWTRSFQVCLKPNQGVGEEKHSWSANMAVDEWGLWCAWVLFSYQFSSVLVSLSGRRQWPTNGPPMALQWPSNEEHTVDVFFTSKSHHSFGSLHGFDITIFSLQQNKHR